MHNFASAEHVLWVATMCPLYSKSDVVLQPFPVFKFPYVSLPSIDSFPSTRYGSWNESKNKAYLLTRVFTAWCARRYFYKRP